jgi:hypothetical protein
MQGQPGSFQPDYTQLDYPRQDQTQLDYQPQDHTQLDYQPQGYWQQGAAPQDYRQGFPPPPSSDSRLPWPPPGGQLPASLPPAGQPSAYGAPMPAEAPISDTDAMLRPKGLFRQTGSFGEYQFSDQGQFGPPAWPGAPANYGGPPDLGPGTLPRGMTRLPGDPGGPGGTVPRQARRLVTVVAVAALVIVALVAVMLSMRGNGSASPGSTATGTNSPTAKASSASDAAVKQAATALAALLPQSGKDRGDVINAVANVESCGKQLAKDAATFTASAQNRQALLGKLSTLPGRAALPASLISALTGAWQASVQVDTDLAKWASAAAQHCHKGNPKDPNLAASGVPNDQATSDKQAFVRQWNPIATRYGLPTYTATQL